MKLGINCHMDEAGCPNLKWLIKNSFIDRIRVDFPCKLMMKEDKKKLNMFSDYFDQMEAVLQLVSLFEEVVIHIGYIKECTEEWFKNFMMYIDLVIDYIQEHRLENKTVLELWNNINLGQDFFPGTLQDFRQLLGYIEPVLERAKDYNIKLGGFSYTLNHNSGFEWAHNLDGWSREWLDYMTVQIYPEREGEYTELIQRFEDEFPNMPYVITEIGAGGTDEEQYCLYRGFMPEIHQHLKVKNTSVYLYHLYKTDENDASGEWLISKYNEDKTEEEKEREEEFAKRQALKYIQKEFTLEELESEKPEDMYCCRQRNLWRKIECLFRNKERRWKYV